MDLFDKVKGFTRVKEAMELGLYPYFRPLDKSEGSVAYLNGRRVIMLGSNNYLGLTTHPKVKAAARAAIEKYGTSCTGSRFLNGTLELHLEMDRRLAKWVGKEAAVVFPTGYQTNVGTITAIAQKGDYVILDKEAHASLVDGALMSYAEMKRFVHNDLSSLERVLKNIPDEAGKLVVVDGIYSMGGEIAPLPEISAICKKYGARLMSDDAHSLGVLGGGRGTAAHFNMTDDVDLIMGTFSKSFASIGGFIAGDADVIHYIQHHARALIFSASMPPSNAAAVLAALEIMETESQHVEQLWENTEFMRAGLKRLGYDTGKSNTPIIPIFIGDDYRTGLAWKALMEMGVYTNPVVSPAVPEGQAMLRTSYMATHTKELLQEALDIFEVVGHNLDLIPESQTELA
jgi:8-amino-7-oxononanoate synthase